MAKSAQDFNERGSKGKIEQYLPEQNAQRIVQIAGAIAGGGEPNTGSNVGTDGVGVFDAKVVYDLQFRHIASTNPKITVVLNGKDIDLTVVVGTTADTVCVGNDARLSDARTPLAHVLSPSSGPHTGTLLWTELSKTGSSLADLATREHSNLSDAPTDAHHNEAHVLANTGPHTGKLPLNNIDDGTSGGGSIIRVGSLDWEKLAKGTEGYFLKAGATDISWAQLVEADISDLDHLTEAEAVQAVEDAGLVLSATKVITSENANLAFTFGRSQLGHITVANALFGYRGFGTTSFAVRQSSGFSTTINTATGTNLLFKVNDVEKMAMSATLLNMSIPIAMGTSKITGLGDGSANQDAMAFGQKYTLEQHDNAYHSINYKADFTENTAFNKDFGTLGTEVCVGNDGRLSDAREPLSHNIQTYHTGDLLYTQLDAIVAISGGGAINNISRSDHLHTGSDGSSKLGTGYVENPMNLELDGDGYNIVDLGNLTLRINNNITVSGTATIAGITHDNLVDKSAIESITGEWTYTVFPISPSAAPDANYEFANKKYVDDQVAGGGYSDDDARAAIAYYVTTEAAFASAITAIGTGYGIIRFYAGAIVLTSALLVNGAGHYIIESYGDKTVIDVGGDWKAFNITSAASCIIRNVKIDATDLTSTTTRIIDVSEASNNKIIIDNVKIIGDGTNGYGIYVSSDNCTVKNCWVQDVYNGIYLDTASYFKLINNTCYSNNYHGVYLSNSNYGVMKGNISYGNGRDGIHVITSSSNAIGINTCYNNTYVGIQLKTTANHNSLTGNICYGNSEEGIYINTAHNNAIVGNTGSNNGTNGIWLYNSDNNTINGNTCNDNDLDDSNVFAGIYLSGDSDQNTIVGNTCNNNNNIGAGTGHGIHIADSTCNDNIVGGNTLLGNDINYNDSGTDTIRLGDDTVYNATSWDNDLGTATKNAIRDKIEAMSTLIDANTTVAEVEAISINDVLEDTTPQLGGPLDLNSKGFTHEYTAAVSLINGDLCYMNGSGKMAKADADAEATCDTLLAMCLDTIAADATGTFLLLGKWTTSGLTAGAEYFVSLTEGGITTTRPSAVGDIIRHVGTAVSTTVLFFNPSHTYVEYVAS